MKTSAVPRPHELLTTKESAGGERKSERRTPFLSGSITLILQEVLILNKKKNITHCKLRMIYSSSRHMHERISRSIS